MLPATKVLTRFPGRNAPYHLSTRARRHPARQDAQAPVVAVRRAFSCGDTNALDWRSDARLRAILDRAAQREPNKRIARRT
jgi:hypothetical protein